MSNTVLEATWSDFLRDPKSVTDQLDGADVVLHRRDAVDVHISSEPRYQEQSETVSLISRFLVAVLNEDGFREAAQNVDVMPWQRFLPESDRAQFLREFVKTAAASAELGTFAPLAQLVSEWRNTALIHADPELASALGRTHPGDGGLVPKPTIGG